MGVAEEFKQNGYVEIYDEHYDQDKFNLLYQHFDDLIELLQTSSALRQKLNYAKERFVRSKNSSYYSTDFFGLYDESKVKDRAQVAFYYATHFHDFICDNYPGLSQIPQLIQFFDSCRAIQKSYGQLFTAKAIELGLDNIFASQYSAPPILFKVVKYLPAHIATKPHYDGTAFSLFLDSTDHQALLLSPYKSAYTVNDFASPIRKYSQNSILLIPGTLLTEFCIYPTPHIVVSHGQVRHATIAFAMRPNYCQPKNTLALLPDFKSIEYFFAN